jgi:hypothetical protein
MEQGGIPKRRKQGEDEVESGREVANARSVETVTPEKCKSGRSGNSPLSVNDSLRSSVVPTPPHSAPNSQVEIVSSPEVGKAKNSPAKPVRSIDSPETSFTNRTNRTNVSSVRSANRDVRSRSRSRSASSHGSSRSSLESLSPARRPAQKKESASPSPSPAHEASTANLRCKWQKGDKLKHPSRGEGEVVKITDEGQLHVKYANDDDFFVYNNDVDSLRKLVRLERAKPKERRALTKSSKSDSPGAETTAKPARAPSPKHHRAGAILTAGPGAYAYGTQPPPPEGYGYSAYGYAYGYPGYDYSAYGYPPGRTKNSKIDSKIFKLITKLKISIKFVS